AKTRKRELSRKPVSLSHFVISKFRVFVILMLRQLIRELFGILPTLDLHGYGVREAIAETERFLQHAQAQQEPVVRIVYGKGHGSPGGRGVLRDVIPHWLDRDGAA